MSDAPAYTVVVPTIGRPCLAECLRALAAADGHPPHEVVVVDDRPAPDGDLTLQTAGQLLDRVRTLRTGGKGPAAARNAGWRTVRTPWTVFLDDDVQVLPDWSRRLADDLREAGPDVGGVQGRLRVPCPRTAGRPIWERTTKGLENAAWATADMAYRTEALKRTGGFDERFPRAFREDADLALRVQRAGWSLIRGHAGHPAPGPAGPLVGLAARAARQRRRRPDEPAARPRLVGPRAGAPRPAAPAPRGHRRGPRRRRLRPWPGGTGPRASVPPLWTLGTAEFALARILPGPRTGREIAGMLGTSVLIPPLAVRHWLRGVVRHRHAEPLGGAE